MTPPHADRNPPTERRSDKPEGERRHQSAPAELAREVWVRAEVTIRAGEHFLVVLDETHL
jgi:hypothetical protein